ncbi:hypothetical protein, partial [Lysobacter capsici]|uniref:hypothetical protein n=1 Tax=Lysobacter capsici TaxID=435897 RepID=UPI00398CCB76
SKSKSPTSAARPFAPFVKEGKSKSCRDSSESMAVDVPSVLISARSRLRLRFQFRFQLQLQLQFQFQFQFQFRFRLQL